MAVNHGGQGRATFPRMAPLEGVFNSDLPEISEKRLAVIGGVKLINPRLLSLTDWHRDHELLEWLQ